MRQIDHAHDAENQSQARSQHEQQQSVLNTVQQLDEEIDEIHRGKINTKVFDYRVSRRHKKSDGSLRRFGVTGYWN
jgi:hypothetical protein